MQATGKMQVSRAPQPVGDEQNAPLLWHVPLAQFDGPLQKLPSSAHRLLQSVSRKQLEVLGPAHTPGMHWLDTQPLLLVQADPPGWRAVHTGIGCAAVSQNSMS